jgi:hypothetical protein
MSFRCDDLEEVLREADRSALASADAHAAGCRHCREQLEAWRAVEAFAPSLRHSWESPSLWPRIEESLARESERPGGPRRPHLRIARGLIALAATLVIATAAWLSLRSLGPGPRRLPDDTERRLLTEKALEAVDRSEAEYVASIERLAAVAEPILSGSPTALRMAYRDKLQVLDAAIAECREGIARNRFNVHLRDELLSIYREKQKTLREILEQEERHAL